MSPKGNAFQRVSRQQAEEALLRSGYLLESRLETVIYESGPYFVEANKAYPDPYTGKSRELDLYAMALRRAGPEEFDWLVPVILIECVNNPQPIAFITKQPIGSDMHRYEIKMAGLPVKIPVEGEPDSWGCLADYLDMKTYHHYCRGRVATQFCSFRQKGSSGEWMATHEDEHFDSFRKLAAAVEHFADDHFKSWSFENHENVNVEMYYPVVVLQGELLDARPTKRSARITEADHIQYRLSVFIQGRVDDYQIDVVTERFFPRYLEIIHREIFKTARLMRRRGDVIRNAVDQIAAEAKGLESPDKIRAAMEF